MTLPKIPIVTLIGVMLTGSGVLVLAGDAEAGKRYRGDYPPPDGGYVVAESRYGNGTVSGPVRATRNGYEVRLPGGTWIGCRTSCSETLRVSTIDYWGANDGTLAGGGTMQQECGVFGCLDLRWPRW